MSRTCPACGVAHRDFPRKCESSASGGYGHVIILHYGRPFELCVNPDNAEEVMLSKIRLAAKSYGSGRIGDPVANAEHHVRANSEMTREYFTMRRYVERFWPGQEEKP